MKKTCCLIILVSLVLTSCAQNQYGENSSPMLGVGIGAIGGAILGQALGGDTTSTLIGGTVGALAGYAIAMHTESKTNKVQDARRTREMVPATQRNKPVLKISNKSIIPSKQIQPGEDVTVKVTYILFDESKPQQPVREKKSIWHNGELVKTLGDEIQVRENGTYENSVAIKLPDQLEKGDYEVRHEIKTDTLVTNSSTHFTVI